MISRTLPRRRLAAATLALLLILASLAGPAAAQSPVPTLAATLRPATPPDDFYALDPVPAGPDGELLRAEELYAPDGYRLWAILYRSTGLHDEPIAVSGLLLAPETPPPGPLPILSIAHGTTGLADSCAPSRDPAKRVELIAAGMPAVADGWVVVATDYAGLGTPGDHPYLDGPSAARSVLDAILAAQQVPETGATPDSPAAIQGISQGGHASLWAAELAGTVPGANVKGAVAAAPPGDLRAIADWARSHEATPDSWVNDLTVAVAWSRAYDLPLDELLTPDGLREAERLETECRPDPAANPLAMDATIQPAWDTHLAVNSPGQAVTNVPILYLQGTADAQIPVQTAPASLARLCAVGDTVEYREIEGATHAGSLYGDDRVTEARAWLRARIAGEPATDSCPAG